MFEQLQKIGKALMLPIAVLPAAALLLRIGVLLSSDLKVADGTALTVVWNVMTIAGDAVFGNLALLFAIGVAVGLTEGAGVAALGAAVGYQILPTPLRINPTTRIQGNHELSFSAHTTWSWRIETTFELRK